MWKYASVVLGILLVVSIFTEGFKINNDLDGVINELKSINAKQSSSEVRAALSDVILLLEKAHTQILAGSQQGTKTKEGVLLIEEFSDFECPYSARAYPTVKRIKVEYGNKVEILFRHFPLSFHPNAQKAAEASECARDQNKFWEYHDKLFENRQALGLENYKRWAQELGLDMVKFNNCLDSGSKAELVQKDFKEGQARGVSGTPSFFIGGELLVGARPYENFKTVIDSKLSGEQPT